MGQRFKVSKQRVGNTAYSVVYLNESTKMLFGTTTVYITNILSGKFRTGIIR